VYNIHHPELFAPFPKWNNKFTWGKTRGVPMYCISSASERKHEIACTSWSSCLWKLCELVSNVEKQLCIVFMYTGTPISSPVIQKCVHLKCFCFVYDVWTTDLGFCQVSLLTHFPWQGYKHWNFIWPSLPFSLPRIHDFFSLSPFFFMICDWGIWFILVWPSIYGSPWFVKFSKMANINSPPPLLKFSSIEKVF
jgi:hypothetical protein